MKRLLLLILLAVSVFARDSDVSAINVATEDYGAQTAKSKNAIEISLPVKTNIDEIKLSFKPNKGKLIILAKEGNKEKEVTAIHLSGTEEEASFKLQKTFLKDVRVVFVPDDVEKPLVLYTYSFNVVDIKAIQMYTSLQKSIAAVNTSDTAAGATTETTTQTVTTTTVPTTLPTEFTISRSSL